MVDGVIRIVRSSSYCLFVLRDIGKGLVMFLLSEEWLLGFCTWNVVYRESFSRANSSPLLVEITIPQSQWLVCVEFHIVVIIRIQRVLWLPFGLEFLTIRSRSLNIVCRKARKLSVQNWVQCLGRGTINSLIVILEIGFVDSGRN